MKSRVVISVFVPFGLLLASFASQSQSQAGTALCQPGVYDVKSRSVSILVGDETLTGRFYYPDAASYGSGTFGTGTLPGVILIPGTDRQGVDHAAEDLTGPAARIAETCMTVLTFNYRGQGPHNLVDTEFTFWGDLELQDIQDLIDTLKDGPGGTDGDLVNDNTLGIMGFSQGANATWQAIAEQDYRGQFKVAIPFDGTIVSESWLLTNNCANGHLAPFFNPENFRTPYATVASGPTNTPDTGISWDPTTFPTMKAAYVTNHPTDIDALATVVAGREDVRDELPTGTPNYPHVLDQTTFYDASQPANENITDYAVIDPPTVTPGYPDDALQIVPGNGGHSDAPWDGSNTHKDDRTMSRVGWLMHYLTPAYASSPTAVPSINTPTPINTPPPVLFSVSSYDAVHATQTPVFDIQSSTYWPPAGATPFVFYLRQNGATREILLTPPATTEGSDTIQQYWTPQSPQGNTYNMATAVAEADAFTDWGKHIVVTNRYYVSPILDQDVTLVGAPKVTLFAEPTGSPASTTYQVHVRVREGLSDSVRPFITRANACAWSESDTPGYFDGTPFYGEIRAHEFKEGRRIVVEVTTVDEGIYHRSNSWLYQIPYLGAFEMKIWHDRDRPSNITLDLIPSAAGGIFQLGGEGQAVAAEESALTMQQPTIQETPEPLAIDYQVEPDFTNSGGWRNWAAEVWFDCTGGEGAVECPADTVLATEGVNQTFTFTATDSANMVVTATLPGYNIDLTPPTLTSNLPASQTFCSGATHTLDFSVSDNLSGVSSSQATFNGLPVSDGDTKPLLAGRNTLSVDSVDVARNATANEAVTQVNYNETLDFPPDGGNVNPLLPLSFTFQVNDACAAQGWYANATGTLWLTGPDGVEIPAEWYGGIPGNTFLYNAATGWYHFDAYLNGLTPGTWTARAHLDDDTDHTVTFVIPGGLGGESTEDITTTAVRPSCQDGWLRPLLGVGRCR